MIKVKNKMLMIKKTSHCDKTHKCDETQKLKL